MPRYTYRCEQCLQEFIARHSMDEKLSDCEGCEQKNTLMRIPSQFTTTRIIESNKKVGNVVGESIEMFKEDLKQEKKKLQQEEYDI